MAGAMRGVNGSTPPQDRLNANRFAHAPSFAGPGFRAIVGADPHTLYSLAWLDLSDGPVLLDLPEVGDRFYLISLLDAWSHVFASLSPRTANSPNGAYAVVERGWRGDLPSCVNPVEAPTRDILAICHLLVHKHDGLDAARALQRELRIAPLREEADARGPGQAASIGLEEIDRRPHGRLMKLPAEQFLRELATEMGINPPWNGDGEILADLAGIGLRPGRPFEWATLPSELREAIEAGIEAGKQAIDVPPPPGREENGWQSFQHDDGDFGTDYLQRAQVANFALGLAHPEDALFPFTVVDRDGERLSGKHRYSIRFEPGGLPDVGASWSLALYDMDQLFVPNSIDRYALGSRDELELDSDGTLEIAIQHEQPASPTANWLPAPEDEFNLMLHLYAPSESVLDGSWTIPPVRRVD